MIQNITKHRVAVYAGILLLASILSSPSIAETGTKRALLIGINKYQSLPWLSGSKNDVEVIQAILVNRYGFPPQNIRTIIDEQGTRANILNALEDIVSSSGAKDTVFVHYSGHGSQVKDFDGDEDDGLDETICPTDARTAQVRDITDDELKRVLGRLNVASAVIILDSCHSGTALRSSASKVRSRSVTPDTRHELYEDNATTTRGVIPAPGDEPYVLFSAAAANQQELDGPFGPNGEPLGLLTAALSRALNDHQGNVSPRQIMTSLEGNVEKLKPIFAGHPVPEAQLEGQLRLIEMPLFSPVGRAPAGKLQVVSASSKPKPGRKRVFLEKEKRSLLKRSIADEVAANIEWTDSIDDADAVIECGDSGNCDVYGPDGVVRVATIPLVSPRLATVATNADSVAELLSVDALNGSISLTLNASGRASTGSAPQGSRGIKLTASVANYGIGFYVPGDDRSDRNSLQLSVQSDNACFLTLVTVNSLGEVLQLLPNPLQEQRGFMPDGFLNAYQSYLIPDSFADGNAAGFHMDYEPPAGTDTIRAFCTTDRKLADALRMDVAAIVSGQPGVSIGNTLVSARGLTGLRPDQAPVESGAWGTATITIDIEAQ